MPQPKLKSEVIHKKGTPYKGLYFHDVGEAVNGDRVYVVTLPGGYEFRIAAKNENEAKKELDKVTK